MVVRSGAYKKCSNNLLEEIQLVHSLFESVRGCYSGAAGARATLRMTGDLIWEWTNSVSCNI